VLAQAAGFALLAAISPTALILMAVYLGSASPRATALLYVAGAILMTVVTGVAALIIIRATGLDEPRQHDARYGLRLGLGIVAAIAAVVVAVRKRRPPPDPNRPQKGIVSRLIANPSPRTAFISGLLIFAPGATFIAAVQVIATAKAGVPVTALGLATVVVITVLVVWLPLVAYLAAPDATTRLLKRLNGWLRANGKILLTAGLGIAAVALIVNGALGVADVI
jgi:Sap, sulfolipid-1-addressing protein